VELEIYFGEFSDLFEITFKQGSAVGEEHAGTRRLMPKGLTKKLVRMTDSQIDVQIDFDQPLDVTPYDKLEIKLVFNPFEKGFVPDFKQVRQCLRQVIPGAATQTVDAVGDTTTAATAAAVIGSALL
jgi:hypothetical protein